MEKLIQNKKIVLISLSIMIIICLGFFYFITDSQNKNKKYFDIFLADLYNENSDDYEKQINFLSTLDDPNISFFSDLELGNTDNLDKYKKIDRDLILLKRALIDLDQQMLKNLSSDEIFIFNEIAKIFYLNTDLENYNLIYSENSEIVENFFLKAVKRYYNEIN